MYISFFQLCLGLLSLSYCLGLPLVSEDLRSLWNLIKSFKWPLLVWVLSSHTPGLTLAAPWLACLLSAKHLLSLKRKGTLENKYVLFAESPVYLPVFGVPAFVWCLPAACPLSFQRGSWAKGHLSVMCRAVPSPPGLCVPECMSGILIYLSPVFIYTPLDSRVHILWKADAEG